MKKLLLITSVLFALHVNAQKAYDLYIYKGSWGNFFVTLNYAHGYHKATEIITVHKKSGARQVYTVDVDNTTDEFVYLYSEKNETVFKLPNLEYEDNTPKALIITIMFNDTEEDFKVYKKAK